MTRNRPLFILLTTLFGIIIIYIVIYLGFNVSPEDFGSVGDSIGGIIGPILTLVAAYFAFRAYSKEQESLAEAKIQTKIQENNFKLAKEQHDNQKAELVRLKKQSDIKAKVDEVADSFEFLETKLKDLRYYIKDEPACEGVLAIEKLFTHLRNKDNIPSISNLQILKSLEVCNEIFTYVCDLTLNFTEDKKEQRILIWELVLIYEYYFSATYKLFDFENLFQTAIKSMKDLKVSGSYKDPSWLNDKAIEDLYTSIRHLHAEYSEILILHSSYQKKSTNEPN